MNLDQYVHRSTIMPERTGYQLRHFIIGQHDTAPMRFRQIVLEAQRLAYNMRMAELDIEKKRIQIHRLLSSGDPIEAIEAEELRLGITLTERALEGARFEWLELEKLADETGYHSLADIEADQGDYWRRRLTRQAESDRLGHREGISPGNIESLLAAGLIQRQEVDPCAISPGD